MLGVEAGYFCPVQDMPGEFVQYVSEYGSERNLLAPGCLIRCYQFVQIPIDFMADLECVILFVGEQLV
jgi:hypothetical protein